MKIIFMTLFLVLKLAHANGMMFYSGKEQGWFWYAEEIKKEELINNMQSNSYHTLSPQWIRENIKKYQDLAWSHPTEENIKAFLYLQKYVLKKSSIFAEMFDFVVSKNPILDENTQNPLYSFGKKYTESDNYKKQEIYLKNISKKFGIFFFLKRNCDSCNLMSKIINNLSSYGFYTLAIYLDKETFTEYDIHFPNWKQDTGQAKKLGVISLPAMFLVSAQKEFISIGQGIIPLSEIKRRIIITTKNVKEITDVKDYDDPRHEQKSIQVKEGWIPPHVLLDYFENKEYVSN